MRHLFSVAIQQHCLLILLSLASIQVSGQTRIPLQEEKLKEHDISKGAQQEFALQLLEGAEYIIHAEQKGIDISLTLMNAVGDQLSYQDAPNGKYGPEEIVFAPEQSGLYRLLVAPLNDTLNSSKGKYNIVWRRQYTVANDSFINATLTPGQMLEDLRIFRKIREQFNSGLYRYRSVAQTDSIYKWAEKTVTTPMDLTGFYKVILTLTDFEGSCHNNTILPAAPTDYMPKDHGYFPYYLKYIGGRMVMNHTDEEIPLGATIRSINGIADTVIHHAFFKYFPGDGYNLSQKQLMAVDYSFGWRYPIEFGVQDSFVITYQPPYTDSLISKTIRSASLEEKKAAYQRRHSVPYENTIDHNIQEKYSAVIINDSTALLRFRIFDMAANAEDPAYTVFCNFLDSFFSSIKHNNIRNLIIDIRNNPGGNDPTYEKVFTYLTTQPFRENTSAHILTTKVPLPQYYRWSSSDRENQQIEQKDLEQYLSETFTVKKNGLHYQRPELNPVYQPDSLHGFKGKLYLLIDENVASAASHFASLVKAYTNATIIGRETTGGYYGHNGHFPVEYVLPNSKLITRFSIVYVVQDAPMKPTQPQGRGIIPDIEVSQSLEDFIRNEDTQMKTVLRFVGQ